MTVSRTYLSVATAIVLSASGFAMDAQAAPIGRSTYATATNTCQPAFGASDVAIRKRPLSVQNEGTTNAFVTCSFLTQTSPTLARVYVNAFDGAPHSVTCTGVTGYLTGTNLYVAKTVAVGAGTGQVSITWLPADFAAGTPTTFPSFYFSVSCSLPVGTGVNDVQINYPEEIGT